MKDRIIKGMAGLAGAVLAAMLRLALGAMKVGALSASSAVKTVTLPQAAGTLEFNWVLITVVSVLALAIVVAVVVLLLRRSTSRKRPANLGMPPTMPPPAQLATPSPYAAATPQQPAQPGAAPAAAKLVLPDSSEIPLTGGLKPIGRADFERLLPPDSSKYVSREHLLIGFAYGNYYVQDAGSANGTKLNGREIKGAGSQWLRDGDQINLAGVITVVFRNA